jgi:hypothetical protein
MTNYYWDDKIICECGHYNYLNEDDYDDCTFDDLLCEECEAIIEFEVYVEHKKEVEYKVVKITPVPEEEPEDTEDMWGA